MTQTAESKRDPLAPLTLVAFVLMLALVAARCTVNEWGGDVSSISSVDPGGPGVTTTIVLNGLCLLPALLVLVRRAIDSTYVIRPQATHVAMFALVVWITASAIWASNKADALLSASTWWAAAGLFFAAGQLVRSWTRLRPILGVAAGLTLIFAAQAIIYRFYEQPETARVWDADPMTQARRAADPNDFFLLQMDKKVHGTEQQGFFRSPNTFAAVTVMAGFAALGLAIQRLRDRDEPVMWIVTLAGPLLATPVLFWTNSRTAGALAVLGAIGLTVGWLLRDRLAAASRVAFAAGVAAFLLGVGAVVAVGTSTGGLIVDTLTFRWHYWVASARLVRDHTLLGVGWTNFGTNYLAYRLPVAPEEIKFPHNLFVQLATEVGLIGVVLGAAWLGLLLWRLTRPVEPRPQPVTANVNPRDGAFSQNPWLKPSLALFAVFWLVRTVTLWPITVLPTEAGKTVLFSLCLLTATLLAGVRDTKHADADDRPARFAVWATIIGLLAFLLHNQVDFAALETGPLLLFVLLAGAVAGIRHGGVAGRRTHTAAAIGGLAAVFVALIAAIGLWAVPTMLAEAKAAEGDAAASGVGGRPVQPAIALDRYREAIAASPVPNADYARRAARFSDPADPKEAVGLMSQAIAADPADAQNWLWRARYGQHVQGSITTVANDYNEFLRRNPNDVDVRVEYANALDRAELHQAATEQFEAALKANDALKEGEPRRLSADVVARIKARLDKKD